ncbi:hypothetical protein MKX01_016902 [Papaver californicum]|nr:hypothetical protein MKX01_016902 [Papaver californicum]
MDQISASSLLGFFLVLAVLFATHGIDGRAQAPTCTKDMVILGGTCDQCATRCSTIFPLSIGGSLCVPITRTAQCGCCVIIPKI